MRRSLSEARISQLERDVIVLREHLDQQGEFLLETRQYLIEAKQDLIETRRFFLEHLRTHGPISGRMSSFAADIGPGPGGIIPTSDGTTSDDTSGVIPAVPSNPSLQDKKREKMKRTFVCPECGHTEFRSDPESMVIFCVHDGSKLIKELEEAT